MIRTLLAGFLGVYFACAPARAEPALWEIKGSGSTVYLFGTIHALPPGTVWESSKVSAAVASSRELYLEVANPDPSTIMQSMMQLGMDMNGSLLARVSAEDRPKLEKIAASIGMTSAMIDHMRPWMVALLVQELPAVQAGFIPESGVEATLTRQATGLGVAVKSLESTEQQLHIFADLPDNAAAALLHDAIDESDPAKAKAKLNELLTAWKSGDLATLAVLDADMLTLSPTLYDRILVTRNRRWAGQIGAMLTEGGGNRFIAVGAGHLAGPDSVVAILARQGIEVTRVPDAP